MMSNLAQFLGMRLAQWLRGARRASTIVAGGLEMHRSDPQLGGFLSTQHRGGS
jgi:hypothetical protein